MSESCREQRPLLCDEFLGDEPYEFSPHKRRHMGYRGRARNNIKGAVAIIKNWPDYWTASISTWWIIFGMIAITIFIIYNSVLYATLPSVHSKLIKQPTRPIKDSKLLPDIFIHILVNNENEADINKYLPYIEIEAKRHSNYKFNLIVLFNDTTQMEKSNHQAELNNDEALNLLWAVDNINDIVTTPSEKFNNIFIKHASLSNYLNASPLRTYWKRIPHQFIDFFVRAVSVWEKGGIAFNPIILTPRSPHSIYIEKLYGLIQTYQLPKRNITRNTDPSFEKIMQKHDRTDHKRKSVKRINNIRDIIDAMDNESSSLSELNVLSEAESRQFLTKVDMKPYLNNVLIITKEENVNLTGNIRVHEMLGCNTTINTDNDNNKTTNNSAKPHFLPSLFDLIFRDKSMYEATTQIESKRVSRNVPDEYTSSELENNNIIQPMIIPAPTLLDKISEMDNKYEVVTNNEYEDSLTIDLKGNLLSTRIPCHAFIGTVFNNVKHCAAEETLKDFIISELSQFCKGLLSTCKGIDVILL